MSDTLMVRVLPEQETGKQPAAPRVPVPFAASATGMHREPAPFLSFLDPRTYADESSRLQNPVREGSATMQEFEKEFCSQSEID